MITTVDAQLSADGGIFLQVLGQITNNGLPSRKFAQSFFLAEQQNGYYVLNDIFRYLKEEITNDFDGEHIATAADSGHVKSNDQAKAQPAQPKPVTKEQVKPATPQVAPQVKPAAQVNRPPSPPKQQTKDQQTVPQTQVRPVQQAVKEQQKVPVQQPKEPYKPVIQSNKPVQKDEQVTEAPKAAWTKKPTPTEAIEETRPTITKKPSLISVVEKKEVPLETIEKPAPVKTWATISSAPVQQMETRPQTPFTSEKDKHSVCLRNLPTSLFAKDVNSGSELKQVFLQFGDIKQVDSLFDKKMAFIEFVDIASVGKCVGVAVIVHGEKVIAEERKKFYGGSGGRGRGGRGGGYERGRGSKTELKP